LLCWNSVRKLCIACKPTVFFIGEMLLQKLHFWIGGLSLFTLLFVPCDDSISVNEAGKRERNFAHPLPPILQDAWNKFTSEER
jgi:hypothetical protein